MNTIAVIGAGKWGQALHFALSQNHNVLLASRTKRDLPNFVDLDTALRSEYLVIAIPAQQVRGWLNDHFVDHGQKILVAAKGIEASTGAFLNTIYNEFIDESRLAFISGPSFAAEVMQSLPTAIVINSTNAAVAKAFSAFFPKFIKTYYSNDITGAEIAGAYKNVIAIAGGVSDGLELGNNARASLISRGLVEMMRFGAHFQAKEETFLGLGGSGDLFLTASSTLSRNYRVGYGLAKGKTLDTILEELGEVAEGVFTTKAIEKISKEQNIYTPIAHEVAQILEGKHPKQSLSDLLKGNE
jgi:glycerol-3-phosphate dehydrogenase (NAD(P)+)